MNKTIPGNTVLVTGAGGSIGSALSKTIISYGPQLLILLDQSEQNLYQIQTDLALDQKGIPVISAVGDVCNEGLISAILEQYRPNVIHHVAAFKHVPLMERNPIAAIRNNALGTNILARSAQSHGVESLIMVSTDKAVNPRSIMGASKRLAELALVRWGKGETRMRSVRLGNVLGTHGSVVRVFAEQILAGGPITVTHPDATRYFLTLPEAVDLILAAAELPGGSEILIPDLGEPVKIVDLAHRMIKEAGCDSEATIPITFIGLRPGDKMTEDFAFVSEFVESTTDSRLSRMKGIEIPAERFDTYMEYLKGAVDQYDLGVMLDALRRIVPEYEPGECVLRSLEGASA